MTRFNILPKETKVMIKNGKKKVEEKIYPKLCLRYDLTEDSWYVARNTPRVTLGPDSTKPVPLSKEEIYFDGA